MLFTLKLKILQAISTRQERIQGREVQSICTPDKRRWVWSSSYLHGVVHF